ncbi:unnamed protein product [Ranitomeya imitator]|uniref:Tf2-1-like SH3-like domain-containing protein n=1 Tax=Ranitomeya imitator TaxID=111125 RepID=A0ABN9L9N9_9NEOB|nr:unnamed protein product [Ranitomeya imitator]
MVWLSSTNLCLKIPSKKLGPKFVGPFKVVHIVNSAAVRLDIPSSWKMNSVFHVSLLKKVDTPNKVAMPSAPPIDEDCEFEISRILDSRWHRGGLQYLSCVLEGFPSRGQFLGESCGRLSLKESRCQHSGARIGGHTCEMKTIPSDYLLKLIKRMPRVCKAVIKAKGGYFEEPRI